MSIILPPNNPVATQYGQLGTSFLSRAAPEIETFLNTMTALNPTAWWRMHEDGSPTTTLANVQVAQDHLFESPGDGITYGATGPLSEVPTSAITYDSQTGRHYEQSDTFLEGTTGTIHAIIKVPSSGPADNGVIVGIGNTGGAIQAVIRTRVNSTTHHLQWAAQNSGNFWTRRVDTPVIDDDAWHSVVVTQAADTNGPQIYIDGTLITSDDFTDGSGGTGYDADSWFAQVITDGAGSTAIAAQAGTSSTNRFVGDITEVAYWNGTVLTAAEIASLHTATRI